MSAHFKSPPFCLHLLFRSPCLAEFPAHRVNISLSCIITEGKDCVTVGMGGGSTGACRSCHGRPWLIESVFLPMEEGEAEVATDVSGDC